MSVISIINNKKYDFMEIYFSLIISDSRITLYSIYLKILCLNEYEQFTEEEKKIINDTLTIKDFIIIGNNDFHEKIKIIENEIISNSFMYLNIEQLKIVDYFYFLIIRYEDYQENFEELILLSIKLGITFIIFLYVEKEDNIKINKEKIEIFQILFPIILIYSPNDIITYLSNKLNFYNPLDDLDTKSIRDIINLKIPEISFEQNNEEKYKGGCFELAETFDVDLIKNNLIFRVYDNIDYIYDFLKNIYNIYKEHNALDLFYKQNCKYFGWTIYPELKFTSNIYFVKRFLYIYCIEEQESIKSFYKIINDDLRTRDSYKIYQYINIIALINEFIEKKILASYKGDVFRATKLDENLILKLKPGTNMVNTTFWSTSKDFNVAEDFMKKDIWRNSYIICKTIKNNIDIDTENLNPYFEREVLFLPFTVFKVEKVSFEKKFGKKIYTIELTELGFRNYVNTDNMQVEDITSFGLNNFIENTFIENEKFNNFINNFFNQFQNLMFN